MQPGEKRKAPRRSISYPAFIDLGGGQALVECRLCDASQEGAHLAVADPNSVPNEFILALSSDGAARRRCRVVWRTDTQIGVEFLKDIMKNTRARRPFVPRFGAPEQTTIVPEQSADADAPAEPADQFDIDALASK